jgi:hypothetical protein
MAALVSVSPPCKKVLGVRFVSTWLWSGLQPALRVEGIVLDHSGAPIPNETVTDRSEESVPVRRSTTMDRNGHFRFLRDTASLCTISDSRTRY